MSKLIGLLLLLCVSLTATAQDGWYYDPDGYDRENEGVILTDAPGRLVFALYTHWGPRSIEDGEIPPTVSPAPPEPTPFSCDPDEIPPTVSPAPPEPITLFCDAGLPYWVVAASDLYSRDAGIGSGDVYFSPNLLEAKAESIVIGTFFYVETEDGVEIEIVHRPNPYSNFNRCNPIYGTRTLTRLIRPSGLGY